MTHRLTFCLLLLVLVTALPALAETPWRISTATVLPGGEPANSHIDELLRRLESPEGAGAPLDAEEFGDWLDRADPRVDVEALMRYADPASIRNQHGDHSRYRKRLMREDRVQAGVEFLRAHRDLLRKAERRHGVARQDIVSILMWESGLGRVDGKHATFGVLLAQLLYLEEARGSDPEPSAEELRRFEKLKGRAVGNLTALLRISKEKGQDPTAQRGSWAGAIGYPQFMPSSFRYAVDGDGDGVIDLKHWPDVIFSVANYLQGHGYDTSYRGRKRGIRRYNPIDSYVHGVIAYADAIARR